MLRKCFQEWCNYHKVYFSLDSFQDGSHDWKDVDVKCKACLKCLYDKRKEDRCSPPTWHKDPFSLRHCVGLGLPLVLTTQRRTDVTTSINATSRETSLTCLDFQAFPLFPLATPRSSVSLPPFSFLFAFNVRRLLFHLFRS